MVLVNDFLVCYIWWSEHLVWAWRTLNLGCLAVVAVEVEGRVFVDGQAYVVEIVVYV